MDSAMNVLHPLPEPKRSRDRPLEVLCLGLSRSGTMSLFSALKLLGYGEVYHGITFSRRAADSVAWVRLLNMKYNHSPLVADMCPSITVQDFDKVIGDCASVTDVIGCAFWPELLRAYPDAKVILNYRADVDGWQRSMMNTVEPLLGSRWMYFKSLWTTETYWMWKGLVAFHHHVFAKNVAVSGQEGYHEYYRQLESALDREGRPYLKWEIGEGW